MTVFYSDCCRPFDERPGRFNTRIMDSSNTWTTNCWVHLTAFAASISIWFLLAGKTCFPCLMSATNYIFERRYRRADYVHRHKEHIKPRAAYATMLILLAQLVTSCVIEAFALFGTEKMCLNGAN